MSINDDLGLFSVDFDAIQAVAFFHFFHNLLVGPRRLFHLDNGVEAPVGDKEVIAVHHEAERVPDHAR